LVEARANTNKGNAKKRATGSSYATSTTIRFGNGNGNQTECDYPNSENWNLTSSTTVNSYASNFSLAKIISCGFNSSENSDYRFYNNTVTITRKYVISSSNGRFSFNRSISDVTPLSFIFPKKVSVTSNVQITANNLTEYHGLTLASYSIETDTWDFILSTATLSPYRLSYNGIIDVNDTSSRLNGVTYSLTNCDSSSDDACIQEFKFQVPKCDALNFELGVLLNVTCRNSSGCVLPNQDYVIANISIITGGSCPLESVVQLSNFTMHSFSNESLAEEKQAFGTSEKVYFGVAFYSPNTVSQVDVTAVCVSSTPFAAASTCNAGNTVNSYTSTPSGGLTAANKINETRIQTSFYVNGADIASKASSTQVYVQAELSLTYGDSFTKRTVRTMRSRSISTSLNVIKDKVQPATPKIDREKQIIKENVPSSSTLIFPVFSLSVILLSFFL
jgi:hypothetical protein